MEEQSAVYRIDKFVVPEGARGEFMRRVRETHEVLRAQPGFVRDLVVEQAGGPGESKVLTLVEWAGDEAVVRAKTVVQAFHQAKNFSPQELFARLGIQADQGSYRALEL